MMGIYLSGTGNTKHCVEKLVNLLDAAAECIPLEAPHVTETLEMQSTIILGYPTQFSNAPFMVRDFIRKNRCLWNGKSVFCLNTMGLFSGDGTGCAARLLKKYGAQILGGVQIKMPDSVCDNKLLKKSMEENRQIVKCADQRIEQIAEQFRESNVRCVTAASAYVPKRQSLCWESGYRNNADTKNMFDRGNGCNRRVHCCGYQFPCMYKPAERRG